jgi:hypothetical protein
LSCSSARLRQGSPSLFLLARSACPANFEAAYCDSRTAQASKDSESNKELGAKGAIIKAYDVASADPTSALAGVDVLISAIGFSGLQLQSQLLRAALTSGVKLFVPAEWGEDTDENQEHAVFKAKAALRQEAVDLGMPTVAFHQ